MIGFKIKTDKEILKIFAPASWREITLEQLIKLESDWDRKNILKLFSIITGLDVELLANSNQSKLEDTMLAVCAFAFDQPAWDTLPRPEYIQIGDDLYKTPDSIDRKLLGQKILLSQLVIKNSEDLVKIMPRTIAIYMQLVIDKRYDAERIDAVEKLVLKSSAMDCYGLAKFFFQNSTGLISFGLLDFQPSVSPPVPMRRILNGWQELKGSLNLQT